MRNSRYGGVISLANNNIIKRFNSTMDEIAEKVLENKTEINSDSIIKLINLILEVIKTKNRVFAYGAGRSGFIGRAFAQRLMHLGINSCFVSDAVTHQYGNSDLLILISGSGETTTPVAIAQKAKSIGGRIVLFTGNKNSTIGKLANLLIEVKGKSKDKATTESSLAPYTSLFDISTLSILDSIGGILMNILEVTEKDIDLRHATIE